MNMVLLFKEDFVSSDLVRLKGRRLKHITSVISPVTGDSLLVGLLNGNMGRGTIIKADKDFIELKVCLNNEPPAPVEINLILALPRPKMFKRVLESVTSLGIKNIWLINSWKVEKSFWLSPVLSEDSVRSHLELGLEQAVDTVMPKVEFKKLFKPFVEDELPEIVKGTRGIVAHPGRGLLCPVQPKGPLTLAIGPEGGFTPYEVDKLEEAGFEAVNIGKRILRVETAVPFLISRLKGSL